MTRAKDDRRPSLGALFDAVCEVQPTASEPEDARVVAVAMWTGRALDRQRNLTRIVAAGAALAATLALAFWLGSERSPELIAIELATGDELRVVAGSEFRIEPDEEGTRRLHLDRGAMLLDVRPLSTGERFEVITPSAHIEVVGTVFAVATDGERTHVTVFEGRVRVRDSEGERFLVPANEGTQGELTSGIASLEEAGLAAAARRSADARTRDTDEAEPTETTVALMTEAPTVGVAPAPVAAQPTTRLAVVPAATAREPVPVAIDPAGLRGWIADGRAAEALVEARGHEGAEYVFVEADALRAMRHHAEAASAYERAASTLTGFSRAQASYLAASLHASELSDPEGTLAILDASTLDAEGAPLRERAMVLRATALEALGRDDELRAVAEAYIEAFSSGSRVAWMEAHR